MRFGLDYDGTISEDIHLWKTFYYNALDHGHEVIVVTMRYPSEEILNFPAPVVYTSRQAKKVYCDQNGIDIDVWIDDNPHWLFEDSI